VTLEVSHPAESAGRKTTGTSAMDGAGGSSFVARVASPGSSGLADEIFGAQVESQHGIGATSDCPEDGASTQHTEQRAPIGAARNANARTTTTASRCTKDIFTPNGGRDGGHSRYSPQRLIMGDRKPLT
jgi:hypothetical protein